MSRHIPPTAGSGRPTASPLTDVVNVGPSFEKAFLRAGIGSAEELRALGADAAYERLLEAGDRPHFIAYYSLVLGLQGRPWTDCTAAEKPALRARFDTIKTNAPRNPAVRGGTGGPDAALEAMLDAMGVRATPAAGKG